MSFDALGSDLSTAAAIPGIAVGQTASTACRPYQVQLGIETERGPWVQALLAAGYVVFAINRLQVARYRERHSPSGAKSDPGDAHLLAEIIRLDRAHHRRIAGDSEIAEHAKIATRAHQSMGGVGRAQRHGLVVRPVGRARRARNWPVVRCG